MFQAGFPTKISPAVSRLWSVRAHGWIRRGPFRRRDRRAKQEGR